MCKILEQHFIFLSRCEVWDELDPGFLVRSEEILSTIFQCSRETRNDFHLLENSIIPFDKCKSNLWLFSNIKLAFIKEGLSQLWIYPSLGSRVKYQGMFLFTCFTEILKRRIKGVITLQIHDDFWGYYLKHGHSSLLRSIIRGGTVFN